MLFRVSRSVRIRRNVPLCVGYRTDSDDVAEWAGLQMDMQSFQPTQSLACAVAAAVFLIFLPVCAAVTPVNSALEAARSDYKSAESSEQVFLFAGPALEDAGDALGKGAKPEAQRLDPQPNRLEPR
jgi:hypothetical protein